MKIDYEFLEEGEIDREEFDKILEEFEKETNLSRKQAICYILTTKCGFSSEKASEPLPIAAGTVRTHKQRAIEKIESAEALTEIVGRWIN